jgi:hypothetical protein
MSRQVKLVKGADGLGIALRTNVHGDLVWPIVHSVRPGSEAALSRVVAVGDRVEAVNGFRVSGKTHHFVKDLLQLVPIGSSVELKLADPIGGFYRCVWWASCRLNLHAPHRIILWTVCVVLHILCWLCTSVCVYFRRRRIRFF